MNCWVYNVYTILYTCCIQVIPTLTKLKKYDVQKCSIVNYKIFITEITKLYLPLQTIGYRDRL